jgi:hypothetical protein
VSGAGIAAKGGTPRRHRESGRRDPRSAGDDAEAVTGGPDDGDRSVDIGAQNLGSCPVGEIDGRRRRVAVAVVGSGADQCDPRAQAAKQIGVLVSNRGANLGTSVRAGLCGGNARWASGSTSPASTSGPVDVGVETTLALLAVEPAAMILPRQDGTHGVAHRDLLAGPGPRPGAPDQANRLVGLFAGIIGGETKTGRSGGRRDAGRSVDVVGVEVGRTTGHVSPRRVGHR